MLTKAKLVEAYQVFRQEVAYTAYDAEGPVYTADGTPHAPTCVQVWVCRNVPTFKVLWAYVTCWVAMLVCRMRGHVWVDNSYGGPESGCVDVYCARCGHNHHVTLY